MENQNYMSEYIRPELIVTSMEFYVRINQTDQSYDLFDNKNEKVKLLPAWEEVRELIENCNILDPHQKMLHVNRLKLGLSLSLFHYIPFKPDEEFILDQEYISALEYIEDLKMIRNSLRYVICKVLAFTMPLENLLNLSILFKIQFPLFTSQPVPTGTSERLNWNFLSSRKEIQHYCEFHPTVKVLDLEKIISSGRISIPMSILNSFEIQIPRLDASAVASERNISDRLKSLCFDPVADLLLTQLESARLSTEESLERIEFAYRNRSNQDSDLFIQLINQCLFEMMFNKSNYGIAIDGTHVLLIRIESSCRQLRSKKLSFKREGVVTNITCEVACIPHSTGEYNLCSLIAVFANSYFNETNEKIIVSIETLKESSKLSDKDIKQEQERRYKMMKEIGTSSLDIFTESGDWYFYKKTIFKVPKQYMTEVLKLEIKYSMLNSSMIGEIKNIHRDSSRFSKVYQVKLTDERSPFNGETMFLKVFDGVSGSEINKLTRYHQFFGTLSVVFSMFLREIASYTNLRNELPCGLYEPRPSSANAKNYVPYMYSYGYVDLKSENIRGFYILSEYINSDFQFANVESLLEEATLISDELKEAGIIHGDIHKDNLLFDKYRLKLMIIDFGLSHIHKFKIDNRVNLQSDEKAFKKQATTLNEVIKQIISEYGLDRKRKRILV
ncbi:uncharacterized protein RJT21DRAFT_123557 [Scheffersomyces amazonensis]|uniref:uncharacterized protein n=1 Tax=Scheffersomyces amazonensis TaxID=1078765 RepID=UPI00315D39F4